ncbi:MAG: DUF6261 family protein [Prevotellaceae bacterium]|jgi:hypothetical protein|nr:DUF6261 family protein [Prevotellaceae bacterium]
MQKVVSFPITRLNNGVHALYTSETVKRAKSDPIVAKRMSLEIEAFEKAVEQEESLLKLSSKSLLTAEIVAADKQRVTLFTSLHKVANSYLTVLELAPSATAVVQVIRNYNINVEGQLDQKSGLMGNLIHDCQTTYAADIGRIGLTELVSDLASANQRVIDLMEQRDTDRKDHVNGALRSARKATDAAYHYFIETLNAHVQLEGESGYADFISYLNSVILRYRHEIFHQKGKHPSGAGDGDAGGGGNSGGDGGDEPTG